MSTWYSQFSYLQWKFKAPVNYPSLLTIYYIRCLIVYKYEVLFSYLLFPLESIAFFLVECQNERDGLARGR